MLGQARPVQVLQDGADRPWRGIDEGGRLRPPGEGLDAERSRPGEEVQDPGADHPGPQAREQPLPGPVGDRPGAGGNGREAPAPGGTGHHPHRGSLTTSPLQIESVRFGLKCLPRSADG